MTGEPSALELERVTETDLGVPQCPDLAFVVLENSRGDPRRQVPLHSESTWTFTVWESVSPVFVACPHLRERGSTETAVQATLPRPLSSSDKAMGMCVKPLMRALWRTMLLG